MTSFVKGQENAVTSGALAVPARPQPVALEVPVVVNGARAVDGSDKREPFSERSQTVLVFGHGAVIRVSAALAPGQLIFLTNEKTKKEVVCQVVKSKSDGSAVGYVELRFTEPAPGFWGMRFPSDTVLPQAVGRPAGSPVVPAAPKAAPPAPPVPPAATARPIAPIGPKPVAPAAPVAAKPVVPAPPAPATLSQEPLRSLLSSHPSFEANAYPLPQEPESPAAASLPVAEVKPVFSSTPAPASSSNPTTEELKQQAARLQEQLSSLLFTEPAKATSPAPAKQVFDTAMPAPEPQNASALAKNAPPPAPAKFARASLHTEELQIPAWLAPLARETDALPVTAAPSPIPADLPAEVPADSVPPELPELGPLAESTEPVRRPETAVFGGQLLGESAHAAEVSGSKSRTGLFTGIAAALLLVAGGAWYMQQPGNAISGLLGESSSASRPATATEAPANSSVVSSQHSVASSASSAAPAVSPSVAPAEAPAPESNTLAPTFSRSSNFTSTPVLHPTPMAPASRNANSTSTPVASNTTPPAEPSKKASLGEVRLATPKLNGRKAVSAPSDSAPSLDVNPAGNFAAPVSAINTSRRAEPAAPAPIGGDVKPAKLIKSVPPVYPDMARTQHLSGNVQVDALIDAEGNVSSVKALSGPALLHQAALNAVKQWKYQPAELDGKPTAMHLTVTVQFRAQ